MNTFILKELPYKDTPYMVLSTDYLSPEDYLEDLSMVLKDKSYNGPVLFDLLVTNGPKDRFYKAVFDGKVFDLSTFMKYDVANDIKSINNEFFQENYNIVKNSTLNDFYKYLIREGKLALIS